MHKVASALFPEYHEPQHNQHVYDHMREILCERHLEIFRLQGVLGVTLPHEDQPFLVEVAPGKFSRTKWSVRRKLLSMDLPISYHHCTRSTRTIPFLDTAKTWREWVEDALVHGER